MAVSSEISQMSVLEWIIISSVIVLLCSLIITFTFCCCCCSRPCRSPLGVRLLYIIILVFVVVISSALLVPSTGNAVENSFLCQLNIETPTFKSHTFGPSIIISNVTIIHYNESEVCRTIFGYTSVYRMCLAVSCFFFIMMLIMLGVNSTHGPRACIHNWVWFCKWLIIVGLVAGFFFIPRDHFIFSKVSIVIGMIGAFIFITLQVIFLIDFAHSWAESWLDKQRETENNLWYIALLIPTIIFYFLTLVGIILMFVFFVRPGGCELNIFFLCSIFILSVTVSVIAILPPVHRVQPTSGLLQASIVAIYTTYLTFSALSNEPYGEDHNCPLSTSNDTFGQVSNAFSKGTNEMVASLIGILVMLITVIYTGIYLSNNKQLEKLRGNRKDEYESSSLLNSDTRLYRDYGNERDSSLLNESEDDRPTYSYSFFHFMMAVSVLYLMMQLTNWYNPGIAESNTFQNTWASVWIKMSSTWLCFAIYLWTLLAPLIFNDRDFGYGTN